MRKNVCLKSTLRQPAQTLLLILLVGLICFAFVSRVVEYLVVNRETNRLAKYYRSIGSLDKVRYESPDEWEISRGVEIVSKSPYVVFQDLRRRCSGVLQGIYNSDVDGVAHHRWDTRGSDVLFYGKLLSKAHLGEGRRLEEYRFIFEVDEVVTGYPEYIQEGGVVRLEYFPKWVHVKTSEADYAYEGPLRFMKYIPGNPDELDPVYGSLEIGSRYLVRGCFDEEYQWFYRHEKEEDDCDFLVLKPLSQSGTWFFKVEPGASADLSDPALAGLAEELAVMNENQHAMNVTSTADMSAMPWTQQAVRFLYLTEGRWLNSEDNLEGRRVCVVHNDFAVRRGLSLGDTITLKLRDLKSPYLGYIVPGEDWNVWQSYETHTEEFEIVGLFVLSPTVSPSTRHSTLVFIPDSCMPAGYGSGQKIDPNRYSFVLDSPEHEDAFLAENQKALEELGIKVTFVETGWKNFKAAAGPVKHSAAINVRVFSAVLAPAMALAAFLHVWQRRRDFAILRSMGVPKVQAVRQLVWSMTAIGITGVTAGGLLSWRYALGKAAKTLASLQGPQGPAPSTELSPVWLAGLCTLAFTVLLSFTVAGAIVTSRRPVLELLQGTESRATRKRKRVTGAEDGRGYTQQTPVAFPDAVQVAPGDRQVKVTAGAKYTSFALSSRYVLKHIRRAPLRSILTVSVALGFTLALGRLNWSIERNDAELDTLYRATQVEVEIVKVNPFLGTEAGFIPSEKVDAILETGFIKDSHLVATAMSRTVGAFLGEEDPPRRDYNRTVSQVPLWGINQAERFFSENEPMIVVEYATGWDATLFSKDWTEGSAGGQMPAVLPSAVMSRLQLKLGDSVWIQDSTGTRSINCKVVGRYWGTVGSGVGEEPVLLPLSTLKSLEIDTFRYHIARFAIDPEKNRELPEFRSKMNELFAPKGDSEVRDVTLIYWDSQLTEVVEPMEKNLLLIKILRSVTITASALIAAGLGALMVFQKAKEAAIMRVLGVTKRLARSVLCGEQGLLCLLGLTSGLGSCAALRGQVSAAFTVPALGCAALYLAGCLTGAWLGARSVTDRPPLDLLQVKE